MLFGYCLEVLQRPVQPSERMKDPERLRPGKRPARVQLGPRTEPPVRVAGPTDPVLSSPESDPPGSQRARGCRARRKTWGHRQPMPTGRARFDSGQNGLHVARNQCRDGSLRAAALQECFKFDENSRCRRYSSLQPKSDNSRMGLREQTLRKCSIESWSGSNYCLRGPVQRACPFAVKQLLIVLVGAVVSVTMRLPCNESA